MFLNIALKFLNQNLGKLSNFFVIGYNITNKLKIWRIADLNDKLKNKITDF